MKSNLKILRWLALSVTILSNSFAADLTSSYKWKPLKIGAGGWVVGMDMHPTALGVMYCRADVSGAYRWDQATSTWKQIVTASSLPSAYVEPGTYVGVDSIVCAPNNSSVAYMAYKGQIFRSSNKGDTWNPTNFGPKNVQMAPNGPSRRCGERLGVDPNNNAVVYYCPINDHPWMTTDLGVTWTKIISVPLGVADWGITTVKIDKSSGTAGVKSNVVYMTVEGKGVWKTADGGVTWANIALAGPGNTREPRDAAIGVDGMYYVCYGTDDSAVAGVGGIWKYNPTNGAWLEITPSYPAENGGDRDYEGIAVNPYNANQITIMERGGRTWTTTNQGTSWTYQGWTLVSPEIVWLGQQSPQWLGVGQLIYDPKSNGRLWMAEGFGVWKTTDLADKNVTWTASCKGIEETCGNGVICPPGGKPVSAMWDVGSMYHSNPDAYTAIRRRPAFISSWDLDWSALDPAFVVGVFHDHTESHLPVDASGYSNDGGQTWTTFSAVANGTAPAELRYGLIAASANSKDKIVWSPGNGSLPYYTTDRGVTWTKSSFGGPTTTGISSPYSSTKPLCADRVLSDTFYYYRSADGIYKTTNAGATWLRVGNNPVSSPRYGATLKAAPGFAGYLWFSEGKQSNTVGGLWFSTNGGVSWNAVSGIGQAFNFGFGKTETPGGYPTIFVAGVSGGINGIYRSTNSGASWDKICGWPLGIFDYVEGVDGDKDLFGKVYISFGGSGCAYGESSGL